MDNKICVYAICKNEAKFVDKWYESMREADEIVVLDTGSTDDTVEKLKSHNIKVETKIINPWRFDVARNESMKLIPDDCNILVCTDLDEVFEKGWATILKTAWKEDTNRCFYKYIWSHTNIGEAEYTFKYDKIHDRNFNWVFPVHEVLYPIQKDFMSNIIDLQETIVLHHYPDKTKDRSNYMDLLETSVKENPDDSHVRLLYAREFIIRKDKERALEEYLKILEMSDVDEPNKRNVLLSTLLTVGNLYKDKLNYDEAIWYFQEFIKEDYTYREPYILLAEMYNDMTMYSLAESMVETALKYGYKHYDWVEFGDSYIGWPQAILAFSQYKLGHIDEAIKNCEEALKHFPDNIEYLKLMNACLQAKIDINNEKIKQ